MLNLRNSLLVATLLIASSSASFADERYRPVENDLVIKECGACHMTFQAQMLPKRSWVKIMDTLDSHFGEDATLNETKTQQVKNYLVDNAADSGWWNGKFRRGIDDNMTPLRISEMPYWVREHNEEVPNWAWSDPKVKSKANCEACHPRAKAGNYDDD